jgi:hypothetical protein
LKKTGKSAKEAEKGNATKEFLKTFDEVFVNKLKKYPSMTKLSSFNERVGKKNIMDQNCSLQHI